MQLTKPCPELSSPFGYCGKLTVASCAALKTVVRIISILVSSVACRFDTV